MSKEKEKVFVCFCKHSWKPFLNEEECLDFIKQQEDEDSEYWSYTIGNLEFYTPYLRSTVKSRVN